MIRIVFITFILFNSNVLVKKVYSGCITTYLNAECKSVTELSDKYFNASLENFQHIKELYVTNNDLELYVFASAFLYTSNLETIMIRDSRIRQIFEGTFKDLPLKILYINNNGIKEINPGSFQNLPSLVKIVASNNRLKTIPRGVFKDLPMLNTLTLSKNEITSVENSALENLPELSKLHLDNNNIDTIFIHKVVSHPEQLEILWMHNNSLTLLTNFMLQKLTKLKLLNLGFNEISTIEVNAFEQTPQLETLVLTNNKLRVVGGNVFPRKGLDYLKKLYLDNNELMFLPSSFFFRMNNLRLITLVGNPWACPCLDFIHKILAENEITERCQNIYVTGQRPICVSNDATSKVCSYEYDSELSDIYLSHKRKFPVYVRSVSCIL